MALRKGCGLLPHPACRAAHMPDENLTFRPRKFRHRVEENVDGFVRQIHEVMTLPVIAGAGRQQRVESLLPTDKWCRTNDVSNGLADRTQFGHRLLALFNIAAVAHRENEYFAPVPLRRQKRQGRSLTHDHPAGQLIRSRSGYSPVFLKHRCGVVEWMDYKSGQYLRTELVKPELECGDNAEVSATAT